MVETGKLFDGVVADFGMTIYRYVKYLLFPAKAISKTPSFFANYLDTGVIARNTCIISRHMLPDWLYCASSDWNTIGMEVGFTLEVNIAILNTIV